jgi:hypothetical protein
METSTQRSLNMIRNRFLHQAVTFPRSVSVLMHDPTNNIYQQLPVHTETFIAFDGSKDTRTQPKTIHAPTKYAKTGNITGIRHKYLI